MKQNIFRLLPIFGLIALPVFLSDAAAQQISALDGVNRVGSKHGSQAVQKMVEMKGYTGQSQPTEWRIIAHDPRSETSLREYWIGDTRATDEGASDDFYPKRPPVGFIDLRRLKLGSVAAFKILDREASRAKIGFDSIDYHLRCREFSSEPIWTLTAKNDDGYIVARVDMSAESGKVLRTIWSPRQGRRYSISDSALLKRPEPEPLPMDDGEAERRRLVELRRELIGPERKQPEVIAPVDPSPVEDPGTEVPEVLPLDPEDLPGADEP